MTEEPPETSSALSDRLGHGVRASEAATPERLPTLNRGHWTIEANHHLLDRSFDEDRSRIHTGHGPDDLTRPRRFAIGLIKASGLGVAETMRKLARSPRRVPDFLRHQLSAGAHPRDDHPS